MNKKLVFTILIIIVIVIIVYLLNSNEFKSGFVTGWNSNIDNPDFILDLPDDSEYYTAIYSLNEQKKSYVKDLNLIFQKPTENWTAEDFQNVNNISIKFERLHNEFKNLTPNEFYKDAHPFYVAGTRKYEESMQLIRVGIQDNEVNIDILEEAVSLIRDGNDLMRQGNENVLQE